MNNLICTVDGCEQPQQARGYCGGHYQRVKKHGTPGTAPLQKHFLIAAESFAARTEPDGECLIWTGVKSKAGYGRMAESGRSFYAHRYAYAQVHGVIAEGLVIDHICRRPACVNVSHLRAVLQKQNMENVTSPLRNINWDKQTKNWRVKVTHNYKTIHVGRFALLEEAQAAALAARNQLFTCNSTDDGL